MNIKNIKPTGDRLLIERQKQKEVVLESGIVLTPGLKMENYNPSSRVQHLVEKTEEEEPDVQESLVIEVGPDVKGVKKGDYVLTTKYSGADLFKDRMTYLIKENDVLALVLK